jgi:MarR family transcriptional regulator, organic hydroperoxide resistance regulator
LPDKSAPAPMAASEVTGEDFGERAVELTRARLGKFDEGAALVAMVLTRTAVAHLQASEVRVHRPRDWSWSGFRIMWMIWLFEQVEARDIARLTGVSRQATSSVLATLETKGFVRRERTSPTDRRLVAVSLTPEGTAELERAFIEQNKLDSEWFSVLDPQEQQQFVSMLRRITSRIAPSQRDSAG